MLKLYNDLTREKQEFIPIEPGKVRIYMCGPTVYDYFHLGNARAFCVFDTLRRFLEWRGYEVTFVQNFTDVDDKMIKRANSEGITIEALAERFIEAYFEDAAALNIKPATIHPRATETIPEMIALIERLMDKGYAYETEDGVYFEVNRRKDYGKLSHQNLDSLEADPDERLANESNKRSRLDFALWKNRKDGEPYWPSPWGEGRPGWHLECSAMVGKYLGDTIDIHGGALDLVFPHHENEIAQSESATGKPFVRYWMHCGFLNINHEKMSKSAGNFFIVRELLKQFEGVVLRFFLISSHYKMPLNFSLDLLAAAESGWQRIRTCRENLDFVAAARPDGDQGAAADALREASTCARQEFTRAMNDDMNTADALAAIFDLVRIANTAAADPATPAGSLRETAAVLDELLGVLGLEVQTRSDAVPQAVMERVEARTAAKKARDFARADQLRDEIAKLGYIVSDTPQGPKVSRA